MKFRNFDHLRYFCLISEHSSLTSAAEALNLTKGALGYQIDNLEDQLGFKVLLRSRKGIELTTQGRALLQQARPAFGFIEKEIDRLRKVDKPGITIGMATYFASRWLSPRLMNFITEHPEISLRIQPLVDLSEWHSRDLDLAVRWGKGEWQESGMVCERILRCPAVLTCSPGIGDKIEQHGIAAVICSQTLLHDFDGSRAWEDWFQQAGIEWTSESSDLVIPDPNVRVQAVIDGQGLALYDRLVESEVTEKRLYQYRPVELSAYGYYLIYRQDFEPDSAIPVFRDWIMQEAASEIT